MHILPLDILRIILVQFGPMSAKTSTGWGKSAEVNLHSFRSLSEMWWALKSSTGWGKSAAVCTVFEVWSLKHVVGGLRLSDKNQHWADLHSFRSHVVGGSRLSDHKPQTAKQDVAISIFRSGPNSRFSGGDERGIWASHLFGFLENNYFSGPHGC